MHHNYNDYGFIILSKTNSLRSNIMHNNSFKTEKELFIIHIREINKYVRKFVHCVYKVKQQCIQTVKQQLLATFLNRKFSKNYVVRILVWCLVNVTWENSIELRGRNKLCTAFVTRAVLCTLSLSLSLTLTESTLFR